MQFLFASLIGLFFVLTCNAATINVPADYTTIQAAIDAAANGDTVIVADGTYTGLGNWDIDFLGKAITVKSLNGPANCIIDGNGISYRRAFYFHSGETNSSVIDGFTITNFKVEYRGGGIYCNDASPLIKNCTIKNCQSFCMATEEAFGGAIFSSAGTIIEKCTFLNNFVRGGNAIEDFDQGGSAYGGAIYAAGNTTIRDCNLTNNKTIGGFTGAFSDFGYTCGGAVYGIFNLSNSIIIGNKTELASGDLGGYGGALYTQGTSFVTNCLIMQNESGQENGANAIYNAGTVSISNCTFSQNYGSSSCYRVIGGSTPGTIRNSIVWGNGGRDQISNMTVTYSCTQIGIAGTGNISSDPLFTTGLLADFYLSQTNSNQVSNSPCVDAGNDSAVNLNLDRFTTRTDQFTDTSTVDMGYHFPVSARADNNIDYFVDFKDLINFAEEWLTAGSRSDIVDDNSVDLIDMSVFANNWRECLVTKSYGQNPAEGTAFIDQLTWSPGKGAVSHDVYVGADISSVNSAGHTSPEFKGNISDRNFEVSSVVDGSNYWRIDEVGAGCSQKGDVWSFLGSASGLLSRWNFDEDGGSIAHDSSIGHNDAEISGAQWTAGVSGTALDFDGINDCITIPDNPTLNPVKAMTISFWVINRNGKDTGVYKTAVCPDLYHSPSNSRAYQLNVNGSIAKAHFEIFSSASTSDSLDSIASVTPDEWHLITASFDNGTAKIYVDGWLDNAKVMAFTNIMNDGQPLIIGGMWSYCNISSVFLPSDGKIDDLRIYNRALSDTEVRAIYTDVMGLPQGWPRKAVNPNPSDSALNVRFTAKLSWTADVNATSHDVYFGTNPSPGPDEFKGNQTMTTYDPGTLLANTIYYWRIDEKNDLGTATGSVWSFTTHDMPDQSMLGWWLLDENSQSTAYDSAGTNDGTIYGAQWTTGKTGSALDFDGIDDKVVIPDSPALNITRAMTLSFWAINRNGKDTGVYKTASCPEQAASPGDSRAYQLNIIGSTGKAYLGLSAGGCPDCEESLTSIGTVSPNQWHMITATFDGSGGGSSFPMKLYIDGTFDNTKQVYFNTLRNDAQPLIIGGMWSFCGTDTFSASDGVIEDVRLYNRVLADIEIRGLYNEQMPAKMPDRATNPNPANGAHTNVTQKLSWTADVNAVKQLVYFGTNPSPGLDEFQACQTAATYDPGALDANTTYYWRVDEKNGAYIAAGDVWSFTTSSLGSAANPNPANNAVNISATQKLSWTAGTNATSHDVYFGTNPSPSAGEFKSNQTATTYDPGALSLNTKYYWRIDEKKGDYVATGNIWNFTTMPLGNATSPLPANGATYVSLTQKLSWTANAAATSHDVYFGTNPSPSAGEFKGNQTATTYDPGMLTPNNTYYWRIDERNGTNIIAGTVWTFTTTQTAFGWYFNDANGTIASEAFGTNNGTLTNGPVWTNGLNSGALSFDGIDDYVSVPSNAALRISSGSLTISAWVKFNALPDLQTILAKGAANGNLNYALRTAASPSNDEFTFYFHDGGNWRVYTTNNANLATSTWYQVVLTFTIGNGSSIKVYLNNSLLTGSWVQGTGNEMPVTTTSPLTIGGLPTTQRLNGILDDIRMFRATLTANQIQQLYSAGPQ